MLRPRLSSIFSFQINPSFQLSEEDLQYLDEFSFNISSASNVNMSNQTSANLSNDIFGNFSTTTQAVMVEVVRSTAMAGIGTTPSDMAICDFSAIKVANSFFKQHCNHDNYTFSGFG